MVKASAGGYGSKQIDKFSFTIDDKKYEMPVFFNRHPHDTDGDQHDLQAVYEPLAISVRDTDILRLRKAAYQALLASVKGTWRLAILVESGIGQHGQALCEMEVKFYGILTKEDGEERHTEVPAPDEQGPWNGSWTMPEEQRGRWLKDGLPNLDTTEGKLWEERRGRRSRALLPATPETLATLRAMQDRIRDLGLELQRRLGQEAIEATLAKVRSGKFMLGSGAK